MKLSAEIENETHSIEIRTEGEQTFARIDDREYLLEVSEPEPNIFLLKHEGKIFEVYAAADAASPTVYDVRVGNTAFATRIIDPKRLRGSTVAAEAMGGKAEIKTAMPGKIVRVLVSQGDEVQKGDGIIVVEAMKMQNELRSPKDGTVSEIRVAEGDTVSSGDILIVID